MKLNKQIEKVYMLYHKNEEGDEKLIGFLSSQKKAEKLMEELSLKSGFKDYVQGFKIKVFKINKSYHTRGFLSKNIKNY